MEYLDHAWVLWIAITAILTIIEVMTLTTYVAWVACAALIVMAVTFIFPAMPVTYQIVLWLVLSTIILLVWWKIFTQPKPAPSIDHFIGERGLVTRVVGNTVTVAFPKPIHGEMTWSAKIEEPVKVEDDVVISQLIPVEGKRYVMRVAPVRKKVPIQDNTR